MSNCTSEKLTHLRRIAALGGRARAKTFTRAHQRQAGKLGFAATAAKYGKDFAVCKAAAWRQIHPTLLERRVMDSLSRIGVTYEREVRIEGAGFVDFLLVECGVVIEVDGEYWHSVDAPDRKQARRDWLKDKCLKTLGYRVVRLQEHQIDATDSNTLPTLLHQAIEGFAYA
ncbi:MAG: endonuclease domain-containing protein [Chloroflexi bacterium]|nr:endonuclease domain-containing protein [Chloroflexota bacterium]